MSRFLFWMRRNGVNSKNSRRLDPFLFEGVVDLDECLYPIGSNVIIPIEAKLQPYPDLAWSKLAFPCYRFIMQPRFEYAGARESWRVPREPALREGLSSRIAAAYSAYDANTGSQTHKGMTMILSHRMGTESNENDTLDKYIEKKGPAENVECSTSESASASPTATTSQPGHSKVAKGKKKRKLPKEVRDIVENPDVLRILAKARLRLKNEYESDVLPDICNEIALHIPPQDHYHISAAVRVSLRDVLGPKARNADLYIPAIYKNSAHGRKKKPEEIASSQSGKELSMGELKMGATHIRRIENQYSGGQTITVVSGAVSGNTTNDIPMSSHSTETFHFSLVSGVVQTTSNWLSGANGGLHVGVDAIDVATPQIHEDRSVAVEAGDRKTISGYSSQENSGWVTSGAGSQDAREIGIPIEKPPLSDQLSTAKSDHRSGIFYSILSAGSGVVF